VVPGTSNLALRPIADAVPGEFNGTISKPLFVYSESLLMIVAVVILARAQLC